MSSPKTTRKTAPGTAKAKGRAAPGDPFRHLYAIGQTVRLRYDFRHPASYAEVYRITATLPPEGGAPQYRLRNEDENFERVARQDVLEPMRPTAADRQDALIARTFGSGPQAR
ncbi:hypothetical protein [Radicibacter daui]|uniref:hypothetical protein n=1 Tax=Radicibacter daui TaxID=3064829 RepID=UPI004046E63E